MSTAGDTGSATVEFAIVLPAVVLTLAVALSGLGAASQAIRLADAAGLAARAEGRDDAGAAARVIAQLAPGSRVSVDRGDLVCVRLDRPAPLGPIPRAIPLSARGCTAPQGG